MLNRSAMTSAPQTSACLAAAPIRIGCAGWSLSANVAAHCPGQGSHLERYARVFSTVEINSSFYRPHQAKTYARWAHSVPDAFRFSVKLPRTISHECRLRDAEPALRAFLHEVGHLGEKLGCLLLQLPPSLGFDRAVVQDFFALLAGLATVPVVCEPRHDAWFSAEAAQTMQAADVACVRADPPPVAGGEPNDDPARLYLRLHGSPQVYYSAYEDVFLDALAARIRAAQQSQIPVWCVFDNTARGAAIPNALTLMRKLQNAAS